MSYSIHMKYSNISNDFRYSHEMFYISYEIFDNSHEIYDASTNIPLNSAKYKVTSKSFH